MDNSFLERKDLPFREKLQNFFVYYKYRVLAAVLAVIAIFITVKSCDARKSYDLSVVVNFGYKLDSSASQIIAEELEKVCPDFNGDGKVSVKVSDCSYTRDDYKANGDYSTFTALESKFYASFDSAENMVFLLSDSVLNEIASKVQYKQGIVDGEKIPLSGTELEKAVCEQKGTNLDGCFLFCRNLIGSVSGKKNASKYHDNAKKFVAEYKKYCESQNSQ